MKIYEYGGDDHLPIWQHDIKHWLIFTSFTSSIHVHHGIHLQAHPWHPHSIPLWLSEFSHQVDQIKLTQTMTSWSDGWHQLDPVVTGPRWFHVLHVLHSVVQAARQASFFGDAQVKQESNSSDFISSMAGKSTIYR